MDTTKTGALIRELRKERNMTQKDLADQLHLTDRAVSKWERGLCAPDISTLEPLAAILQVTVTELIAGERMPEKEYIMEIEKNVQNTIDYSEQEISNNKKQHRKKIRITICACVILFAGLSFFFLWRSGCYSIIDHSVSPDQSTQMIEYDKLFSTHGKFIGFEGPYTTIKVNDGMHLYPGEYKNIYWSPDSSKYIVEIISNNTKRLYIKEKDTAITVRPNELCSHLSTNFHLHDLKKLGYTAETFLATLPEATYNFIQWGDDSRSILLSYSYYDAHGNHYQGCIWYDYMYDTILDSLDLPPQKASIS